MTGDGVEREYFSLKEAAALLGLTAQAARWVLEGHGLEQIRDEDGYPLNAFHIAKDDLVAYLRSRITPGAPYGAQPLPDDIGDPADLPFARAEIRAALARLTATVAAVADELRDLQALVLKLDKREALERAHLPRVGPAERLGALRKEEEAKERDAQRRGAPPDETPRAIAPGTAAPPGPLRTVGEAETDDPRALAYRTRDGRLYFLYRRLDPGASTSVRESHFFSHLTAKTHAPEHQGTGGESVAPVAVLPRGHEITEPPQGGVPRLKKEWVPRTVREARAAEREDRRVARQREQSRSLPGYITAGTGASPRPDRVVEPGEKDHPAAYAYRSKAGTLYFLYRSAQPLVRGGVWYRYSFESTYGFSGPSSMPSGYEPCAELPEGYALIENGRWATPSLKKEKRYAGLPPGAPPPVRSEPQEIRVYYEPAVRAIIDAAEAGTCCVVPIPNDRRGRRVMAFKEKGHRVWYLHRFTVPHAKDQARERTYYRFAGDRVRPDEAIDHIPDGYNLHIKSDGYSSTPYISKRWPVDQAATPRTDTAGVGAPAGEGGRE